MNKYLSNSKHGCFLSYISIFLILLLNALVFLVILEQIKNMNQNIIIIKESNVTNDSPEKNYLSIVGKKSNET